MSLFTIRELKLIAEALSESAMNAYKTDRHNNTVTAQAASPITRTI